VGSERLEAFSDGVIAILITILVLELDIPEETDLHALRPVLPVFLSYLLSFVFLGIYWNNHHHMLRATERVNGGVLWANMHLLFWLSLVPFTTGWMGGHFAKVPTATYGVVLLGAAIAYYLLQTLIIREQGPGSVIAAAIGRDLKGKASPVIYTAGIVLSLSSKWVGVALYVAVALIWLVPDRRIEPALRAERQRVAP
jgi:uncharacterized membrane protein